MSLPGSPALWAGRFIFAGVGLRTRVKKKVLLPERGVKRGNEVDAQ
ncbi:MAG: hypothetical protein ACYDAA_04285 [Syntrophales bacterium]